MKNKLLIEINSKFVTAIVCDVNHNNTNILFKNKYYYAYNPNQVIVKNYLDETWITKMINDLTRQRFELNTLTVEVILNLPMVKNGYIKLSTNSLISESDVIDNFKNNVLKSEKYKNMKIINISSYKCRNLQHANKNTYIFNYEFISKSTLVKIGNTLEHYGLTVSKYHSTSNLITQSLSKQFSNENNKKLINIYISDDVTLFNVYVNHKLYRITKKNVGLKMIYDNISSNLDVSKEISKEYLFSFGSIPPEKVVDNKIIYSKLDDNNKYIHFYKKDLSEYITRSVNKIFKELYEDNKDLDFSKFVISYSGEITKIRGLNEYTKKAFKAKNVYTFKTKVIGLDPAENYLFYGLIGDREIDHSQNLKNINFNNILRDNKYKYSSITNNISKIAKVFLIRK